MTVANISIEQLKFEQVGDDTKGRADSVLHGQLVLAGCSFHVTAVEVEADDDGVLRAIHPDYTDDVNTLYQLSGNSLSTAKIYAKDYLLTVIPHSA